MTVFVGSSLWD